MKTDWLRLAVDITQVELPRRRERPDVHWVRGQCPMCGGSLVSNAYWQGGKGYVLLIQCWEGLGAAEERTCSYERQIL